jgi:hypothetical protein
VLEDLAVGPFAQPGDLAAGDHGIALITLALEQTPRPACRIVCTEHPGPREGPDHEVVRRRRRFVLVHLPEDATSGERGCSRADFLASARERDRRVALQADDRVLLDAAPVAQPRPHAHDPRPIGQLGDSPSREHAVNGIALPRTRFGSPCVGPCDWRELRRLEATPHLDLDRFEITPEGTPADLELPIGWIV